MYAETFKDETETKGEAFETSNKTLPGLITETQNSTLPFPDPILVSEGRKVTGLSGKILIHNLPPLREKRVITLLDNTLYKYIN